LKLTVQRTLFEIVNLLMALLFVIPLGLFLQRACGWDLTWKFLIPCVSLSGFLMGRLSLTKPMQAAIAMSAAGLAISLVLALVLSWGMGLFTVLVTLMSGFFSVFFYFSARKAAYTIYAPMAVSGILIHLLILLLIEGLEWGESLRSLASTAAICFFLLTLFAFSAKGLRRSVHRTSADRRVSYPAGMQMGNFLLVTGFILVAAFISNIYPLFRLFSAAFAVVLRALIAVIVFIASLFDRRTVSMEGAVSEEAPVSVADSENIMAVEARGEASWVTTGVEIFAFICVMLLVLYALYKLYQHMRASGMRLPAFLQNLRDRFAPVVEEDYVDENENLFDMKQMLSDMRGNLSGALNRLRDRPQKLEDFSDDRMKLRFVFQQMLKRVKVRNPAAAAATPNEIYDKEYAGEEDFRKFMDYYNEAKYSDHPLPPDAGDLARTISKQKL